MAGLHQRPPSHGTVRKGKPPTAAPKPAAQQGISLGNYQCGYPHIPSLGSAISREGK